VPPNCPQLLLWEPTLPLPTCPPPPPCTALLSAHVCFLQSAPRSYPGCSRPGSLLGQKRPTPFPFCPLHQAVKCGYQGQLPGKENIDKGSTQKGLVSYYQTIMASWYFLTPSSRKPSLFHITRSSPLVSRLPLKHASSLSPLQ
jgi:hypothetical protein